ncbi:hypothetical protein MASR2M47_01360 [Draconibacterium sp.]
MLDALSISIVFPVGSGEDNSGKLKTNNNEYITSQVAITKGAVNGGINFFNKPIIKVDKTAPIISAKTVIKLSSKKHRTAMPVKAPLKP